MKEEIKDKITYIITIIFTIICTIAVIYSNIFFIQNNIKWYYIVVADGISFTVLYIFWKQIIKDLTNKLKHKQK